MRAAMAAIVRAAGECNLPMEAALKTMAAAAPDTEIFSSLNAAKTACAASAVKLPMIMTPPMSAPLAKRWDDMIEKRCAPKLADQAEAIATLVEQLNSSPTPGDVAKFAGRVSGDIATLNTCLVDLQGMAAENVTPL